MSFLIGYRDDERRIRYYHGMNGRVGRAVCGSKKHAPRFDEQTGGGNPQATTDSRQSRLADRAGRTAMQVRVNQNHQFIVDGIQKSVAVARMVSA